MSPQIIEKKIAELTKWYKLTEDFSTKKDILNEIEELQRNDKKNDGTPVEFQS